MDASADRRCSDLDAIEALNRDCFCITLDFDALRQELAANLGARGLTRPLLETHPHLSASLRVFKSRRHVEQMAQTIAAVESVVESDGFPAHRHELRSANRLRACFATCDEHPPRRLKRIVSPRITRTSETLRYQERT
jgi:hypothetical protein